MVVKTTEKRKKKLAGKIGKGQASVSFLIFIKFVDFIIVAVGVIVARQLILPSSLGLIFHVNKKAINEKIKLRKAAVFIPKRLITAIKNDYIHIKGIKIYVRRIY